MADKRISQLNSHTSPTGSDLLVIVSNNETKKITYANLSSALTGSQTNISALNQFTQSIDGRVDNLESWSSSLDSTFATDLQVSIVSSSVAATIGIVSQNTGLVTTSSFNSYTASQSTGSLVDRLNDLESVTSSYELKGSGILSGSISYNDLTNIPSGIVSQSTDLSSINTFTQSIDSRVDNLESWSSSLDDTFATDLQVSIVSSSVAATIGIISQNTGLVSTSSFNQYTASISTASLVNRLNDLESHTGSYLTSLNGTISGSSQLTSSYDSRYVLSGSITQTTWDNISGKPVGLVSQSTDITSLNAFTASYFTDSASIDSRITTEKGRVDAILSASTADKDSFAEIVSLINSVDLTNDNAFATYYTSSNARISSLESVTSSYETKGRGIVSGSSQLTSSFDTRYATSASYLTTLNGAISSSSQLTGSFDIRYTLSGSITAVPSGTISGSSQLTASFDTRYALSGSGGSLPSGVISGSSQLTASFATTGSNTFSGSQTITGSLVVSSIAVVNGGVTIPTGSTISLTSGSNLFVDSNGGITGSLTGSVFGIGDVSAFSSSVNTRLNNITSSVIPVGTISGSSQLTASFDTRYLTIDGDGVISGSSQLTSSFETIGRGIISGSSQITGVLAPSNLSTTGQVSASVFVGGYLVSEAKFTVVSSKAMTFWPNTSFESVRFTTGGGVLIGHNGGTNDFGNKLDVSGSIRIWGNTTLTGSVVVVNGLTGSIAATNGVISGSSQLTSSFDTRYALSGSGGSISGGTISGSSQLTSSFDGRYVQTGSFNSYTASINTWTSSIATTGSNTFNGNQTITGSLNLTNGNIVASQITANTSSLYLTSGSNLYIQNGGVVEITGSLNLSGSMTIQSGSITMPNRPAFRVTGAGGGTAAVTTLSGSMTSIDFNQANCWDNTTGTFTAPIAGLYQVNLVCRTNSNSSSSGQIIVYKNNTGGTTGTPQVMIEWAANTTMNHAGGSTISKLEVGDTLKAVVAVGTLSFDGNDNFSVAYIG